MTLHEILNRLVAIDDAGNGNDEIDALMRDIAAVISPPMMRASITFDSRDDLSDDNRARIVDAVLTFDEVATHRWRDHTLTFCTTRTPADVLRSFEDEAFETDEFARIEFARVDANEEPTGVDAFDELTTDEQDTIVSMATNEACDLTAKDIAHTYLIPNMSLSEMRMYLADD